MLAVHRKRDRDREKKDRKQRWKAQEGFFFLGLYVAPSCSLAARRHLTLSLFVPTTPKVNDFTHYCKLCLVFTLSHRRNEYSRPLLLSYCPEVRLYVKICPQTDRKRSSEEEGNKMAKISEMMVWTALSVCSRHACALVKAADTFLFTWPHHQ